MEHSMKHLRYHQPVTSSFSEHQDGGPYIVPIYNEKQQLIDFDIVEAITVLDDQMVEFNSNKYGKRSAKQDDCSGANLWRMEDLGIENLAMPRRLALDNTLCSLRVRYDAGVPYTWCGPMLVYTHHQEAQQHIFDSPPLMQMIRTHFGSEVPHVYATAARTYRAMIATRSNQTIFFTGGSGSGKTLNFRNALQYLVTCTSRPGDALLHWQRVSAALLILRSFGHAPTSIHKDSSRCHTFATVHYDAGGLYTGCSFQCMALEAQRVSSRSFHIFTQLRRSCAQQLSFLPADLQEKIKPLLACDPANTSSTTQPSEFEQVWNAFDTLAFTASEKADMLTLLCGIDQLALVDFVGDEIVSDVIGPFDIAARLLGVDHLDTLKRLLLVCSYGPRWASEAGRTLAQARAFRESLLEHLYFAFFKWIVTRITFFLAPGSSAPSLVPFSTPLSISLLDSRGFENFKQNGLEQLRVNHAADLIQKYFLHSVFTVEQELYMKELQSQPQNRWIFIDFGLDASFVVDLLSRRPIGIFRLLVEEISFPKGTDRSFLDKIHAAHRRHFCFRSGDAPMTFSVRHSHGIVQYLVDGWVPESKGADRLVLAAQPPVDWMKGWRTSTHALVRMWVNQHIVNQNKGYSFDDDIMHVEELRQTLDSCASTQGHYVRCIRPNKDGDHLDTKSLIEQIDAGGLLEFARLCRKGFFEHYTYEEFFRRFRILDRSYLACRLACSLYGGPDERFLLRRLPPELTAMVLDYAHPPPMFPKLIRPLPEEYRRGETMLLVKKHGASVLEQERDVVLAQLFVVVQAAARAYLMRAQRKCITAN